VSRRIEPGEATEHYETSFLAVTHEFVAVIPLRKYDLMTEN
jgi:hypothetical protein